MQNILEDDSKHPIASRIIVVSNPIQAALFNKVILPEFTRPSGKWNTKNQENLISDWVGSEAVVAQEGQDLGRDFAVQKANWNINDTSWINNKLVSRKMRKVAEDAVGRRVEKREIVDNLSTLKDIFKIAAADRPTADKSENEADGDRKAA